MTEGLDRGPGGDAGGGLGPAGLGGPGAFPGNAPPPTGPPRYPGDAAGAAFGDPSAAWGTAEQPPYASWGLRVGGYLIDFVILAVVSLILLLLFRHAHVLEIHYTAKTGTDRHRTISGLGLVLGAVLNLAYGTVLCGSRRGQTVGMMAVRVRAVRDGTFERLSYGRAFGRALAEGVLRTLALLSPVLILVWLLDVLFPLWDKKRQTLHDKVAGSVVLRPQTATG